MYTSIGILLSAIAVSCHDKYSQRFSDYADYGNSVETKDATQLERLLLTKLLTSTDNHDCRSQTKHEHPEIPDDENPDLYGVLSAGDADPRISSDLENPEERLVWRKRSSVSPYISLGALNNLPSFFDQLKETFHSLEHKKEEEAERERTEAAMMSAAENDRSFRPPSTAAVLHAFRNYRPLRRTRSFPPVPTHIQG